MKIPSVGMAFRGVAKFVFISLLGLTSLLTAARAADETSDAKLIEEMRAKLVATQKEILASQDPAEQARLQKSLFAIMEATLPKLSPKTRTPMLISMKVVQPIQQGGADYMQMLADYSSSPQSDFTTVKSRDDIKARLATLQKLDEANSALLAKLANFEAEAEALLIAEKVDAKDRRQFIAGLNSSFGRQAGPLKAIRTIDTKLYELLRAGYGLLDEQWGKWECPEGGPIKWQDPVTDEKFQKLVAEIGVLADRQTQAQQVLSQRL